MKKILVALDGSPRAAGVLQAALAMAQRTGARLLLLRAVTLPPEIPRSAYSSSPDELERGLSGQAREELEELSRRVPAELLAGLRAELGVPWQVICEAARAEEADLILIGAHGYGILDRVLGTTAAKVVNHADRAVLVVRAPERLEAR